MSTSRTIRRTARALAAAAMLGCASAPGTSDAGTSSEAALLDVGARDPDLYLDMRYATADNFLGRAVYDAARCLLVPDAAERLEAAERTLRSEGYGLVVWDCYRPRSVQYAMWEILPDPDYVADPARGSRHNRGAAVDVGLRALDGSAVALPTAHDDFTPRAHRDATDLPAEAIASRERLERAMVAAGWIPLPTEWWHFDAPNWERYPLRDDPLETAAGSP
ncbi:MAG TPA: M15 family metallopeptidase [Gemmatimonadota bacterium]